MEFSTRPVVCVGVWIGDCWHGFRVWGVGFRVWQCAGICRFRVEGSGSRVKDLGFRVEGSGIRVYTLNPDPFSRFQGGARLLLPRRAHQSNCKLGLGCTLCLGLVQANGSSKPEGLIEVLK